MSTESPKPMISVGVESSKLADMASTDSTEVSMEHSTVDPSTCGQVCFIEQSRRRFSAADLAHHFSLVPLCHLQPFVQIFRISDKLENANSLEDENMNILKEGLPSRRLVQQQICHPKDLLKKKYELQQDYLDRCDLQYEEVDEVHIKKLKMPGRAGDSRCESTINSDPNCMSISEQRKSEKAPRVQKRELCGDVEETEKSCPREDRLVPDVPILGRIDCLKPISGSDKPSGLDANMKLKYDASCVSRSNGPISRNEGMTSSKVLLELIGLTPSNSEDSPEVPENDSSRQYSGALATLTNHSRAVDSYAEDFIHSVETKSGLLIDQLQRADKEDLTCMWCCQEFCSVQELDKHSLFHAMPSDDELEPMYSSLPCASEPLSPNKSACSGGKNISSAEHLATVPFEGDSLEQPNGVGFVMKPSSQSNEVHPPRLPVETSSFPSASEISFQGPFVAHQSSETVLLDSARGFVCDDCPLLFPTSSSRRAHRVERHSQERSFGCSVCDYTCESEHRLRHHQIVSHAIRRLGCSECHERFLTEDLLKLHLFQAHPGYNVPFKCPLCNVAYATPAALDGHICTLHPEERPFRCWCGKSFRGVHALHQHVRIHSSLFRLHCPVCFMWFPTVELLCAHKTFAHGSGMPVACPICSKSCLALSDLKKHLTRCHPESRRYQCTDCGLRFTDPSNLSGHIAFTGHTLEPVNYLYKCRTCEVTSFDRLQVVEHEETQHAGLLTLQRAVQLFSMIHEVM